jgi:hypothetical protein
VVEALELDGGPTVDGLRDMEPAQVERAVERVERNGGGVRVEHGDPVVVEVTRELRPLQQAEPALHADRCAAHIALLHRDLCRERSTGVDVRADDDRIEPRAEVVDVRDRHVLYAAAT